MAKDRAREGRTGEVDTESGPDLFDLVGPPDRTTPRPGGVVIGQLAGIGGEGAPRVDFPGNPSVTAVEARSTVSLTAADEGCDLALAFEDGDPGRPIVLGRIVSAPGEGRRTVLDASIDGERIVLEAEREIVLRCGEASLRLTRDGKVYVKGSNLLSRSSGLNRIKGGAVRIN
jgi:hypothetical protein